MIKLNPLLEAMNNIDDNIISNSQNIKRETIRLKRTLISAAVAAVLFTVGFAAVHRNEVRLGDGRTLDIQLEVQENAVIPTEYEHGSFNITPSKVFEMYNIYPLLNDNFTEPASTKVHCNSDFVQFVYEPVYKENGAAVWISAEAALSEEASVNVQYNGNWGKGAFEFIYLNNGSKALIVQHHTAYFTYNGIFYQVTQLSIPDGEHDHNIEKILNGLGVL